VTAIKLVADVSLEPANLPVHTVIPKSGTRLGPYEILHPIGAGGMGDVYAARDTRLQRSVAIKICRDGFSARFEREAPGSSGLVREVSLNAVHFHWPDQASHAVWLAALRDALALDDIHLLGHSWGGMTERRDRLRRSNHTWLL
jgi:hypothetical protein